MLLADVFRFLNFLIYCYNMVFFVWILSSWFPISRDFFLFRFIDALIDPVYYTLLRFLPPLRLGMIDFSPFYMMFFLSALQWGVFFLQRLVMG